MTGRELYDSVAGLPAAFDNKEGVVCGYKGSDTNVLICAAGDDSNPGWGRISDDDNIVTHEDNPRGYFYCGLRWVKTN